MTEQYDKETTTALAKLAKRNVAMPLAMSLASPEVARFVSLQMLAALPKRKDGKP